MNVNAGPLAKKTKVVLQLAKILAAADQFADTFAKRLHSNFKLQRARRKLRDQFAQRLREPVGDHLEVEEQSRLIPFQEKLQQRPARAQVQVEGAIDKFEMLHAAIEQPLQFRQQRRQGRLPHRNIERRKAEFAAKRTAARSFDVNHPMRYVAFVVELVRQHKLAELRQRRRNDLLSGLFSGQQLATKLGEFEVRFPGDDIIGQRHD